MGVGGLSEKGMKKHKWVVTEKVWGGKVQYGKYSK